MNPAPHVCLQCHFTGSSSPSCDLPSRIQLHAPADSAIRHSIARVGELADEWRKWWEAELKKMEDIRHLMENLEKVEGCPLPVISGMELKRIFKLAERPVRVDGLAG